MRDCNLSPFVRRCIDSSGTDVPIQDAATAAATAAADTDTDAAAVVNAPEADADTGAGGDAEGRARGLRLSNGAGLWLDTPDNLGRGVTQVHVEWRLADRKDFLIARLFSGDPTEGFAPSGPALTFHHSNVHLTRVNRRPRCVDVHQNGLKGSRLDAEFATRSDTCWRRAELTTDFRAATGTTTATLTGPPAAGVPPLGRPACVVKDASTGVVTTATVPALALSPSSTAAA